MSPWARRALGAGLVLALSFGAADPAEARKRTRPEIHTVWTGQRLGSIAKRYNVSVDALCHANGIRRRDPIHKGQKLIVPAETDKDGSAARKLRLAGYIENGGKLPEGEDASEPPKKSPKKAKAPPPEEKPAPAKKSAGAPGEPVVHEVYKGQRLGSIAKRYNATVDGILHANRLSRRDPIKPGQLLVVPGKGDRDGSYARQRAASALRKWERAHGNPAPEAKAKAPAKKKKKKRTGRSWDPYVKKPWRRGYVTFVGYEETWKGYVIGPNRQILGAARKGITRVLQSTGKKKPRIHPRLIRLLVKTSDTFGGRPLRVVSGYRTHSYSSSSRHKVGRAIDFAIVGVPNRVLRDYLRRNFSNVGVGYYPNSSFVHFDVREKSTFWVDYSGPGEAPRYAKPGGG